MAYENPTMKNILTLDIEDWCQSSPQALGRVSDGSGLVIEPGNSVVGNTRRLLRILGEHKTRATCFILGSVAEKYPELVREILRDGHEIAAHGYYHCPLHWLDRKGFISDVVRARQVLEKIAGEPVVGYRAPYFSITPRSQWALEVLAEIGMEYDASVFPVHQRYYHVPGRDGIDPSMRFVRSLTLNGRSLLELPTSTLRMAGQNLPVGGGIFLYFLPYAAFAKAIRKANAGGYPAVFYVHPHDLDTGAMLQPEPHEKVRDRLLRWALAVGRRQTERKLRRLLTEFSFTSIREWMAGGGDRCHSEMLEPATVTRGTA